MTIEFAQDSIENAKEKIEVLKALAETAEEIKKKLENLLAQQIILWQTLKSIIKDFEGGE